MRINKIELNNVGPYRGLNKIDFNTKENNITVFGGKNGSGKTTLFNLIKIAIFGYKTIGFVTQNKSYTELIEQIINQKSKNIQDSSSLLIELSYVKNYKLIKIKIIRSWKFPKFNEELQLYLNDILQNSSKKHILLDELHEIFPVKLLKINLFDGELINNLTLESEFYDFLETIIQFYFNLDLIETLKLDFEKFLISSSEDRMSFDELKLKNNILENNILIKQHRDLTKKLNLLDKELEIKKSDAIIFTSKIRDSDLISDDLFNKLSKIHNLSQQNFKEELSLFLETLSDNYLLKVFRPNFENLISNYKNKIDSIIKFQKSQLLSDTNATNENYLHYIDIQKILYLQNELKNFKENEINDFLERIISINSKKDILIKNLKKTKNPELLSKYEEIEKKIIFIRDEKLEIQKELDIIEEKLKQVESKSVDIKHEIKMSKRNDKAISKVDDYIKLLNEFVKKEMEILVNRVSQRATLILKTIKNLNYNEILIDHKLKKILVDNGTKIGIERLSAGERQMLLMILFKAIVELSEKEFPIVFDTPVARLDLDNKNEFIKLMTSFKNNQIVVFSTDREFDKNLMEVGNLKDSNLYLIINKNGESKIISKEYFEV